MTFRPQSPCWISPITDGAGSAGMPPVGRGHRCVGRTAAEFYGGPAVPADTSRRRPVSFTELAGILDRLQWLVADARRARQLTLAEAGSEIGVVASTLMRVEHGGDCSLKNAVLILRWLDQRPEVPRG